MHTLTWTDQPPICAQARVLCTVELPNAVTAEVRKLDPDGYYLFTVGTLFKSETVRCPTADDVFETIRAFKAKRCDRAAELPGGVRLVA